MKSGTGKEDELLERGIVDEDSRWIVDTETVDLFAGLERKINASSPIASSKTLRGRSHVTMCQRGDHSGR